VPPLLLLRVTGLYGDKFLGENNYWRYYSCNDAIYNVGINQNTLYLNDYICRKKYSEKGVEKVSPSAINFKSNKLFFTQYNFTF
jgi:hypothetical protein